jgi:N-acetylgalactosamine-N,N'-diacetylbacillosaminyl-diphospho-undecaprenol 4-alpha-N-acetylgalactosaminyltransferase
MNVLFLINEFERGGAERVVSYLLQHFTQINPKIIISLFILEKSAHAYPIPEKTNITVGSNNHSLDILKFLKLPFLAFRLKRIVQKNGIQIVISFLNRANYVNILSTYYGSNHHCIISERNTPSLTYSTKNISDVINRILIRYLYPSSHSIISVSNGVKEDLLKFFSISDELISTIYNPYDISTIKHKSKESIKHEWFENESYKIIVNVGRLEKQKNHELLINAFSKVNKKLPETRLLIIGEGSQRNKLSNLIGELNLNSKIQLVGQLENPFTYVSKSHLFVLSSDFEGFPNALVEAMICGCPVISTDCPSGPNEILINKENGILIPTGDVEAMKNAIVYMLKDRVKRIEMAKKATDKAYDFSVEKIANQYYQLLYNFNSNL